MAQGFKKFMGKGDSGAKKKERIRQEKKKVRQETKEYFEKKKQEAREARAQGQAGGFQSQRGRDEHAGKRAEGKGIEAKRHKGIEKGNEAPRQRGNEKEGYKPKTQGAKPSAYAKASATKSTFAKASADKASKTAQSPKPQTAAPKPQAAGNKAQSEKNSKPANKSEAASSPSTGGGRGEMPLNKFIAHSGICSRRDAVDLVKAGKVIVNGQKIVEPGHKVSDKDDIKVNGKKLFIRRNLVYILINKPKDFLTTTEDPQGRKTVMDIIKNATEERVYPIGRLDRNTTGVLLLTNDGELAQKLSHPSYEIKKIYEVKLDKPLIKKDFDAIVSGVNLEDGFIAPDLLAYADPKDKSVIGIEIHSGRNRIVRRIFEHMGYDVRNLDRVMYANLTKKNVDRGKWRFLTEKEVRLLKYLNASYTKNKTVTRG